MCLEESLYIHNIRDMKVLHTIRDTPPNPTGLCALSINNDNCYLAYPGSNQIGEVQIFDCVNLVSLVYIQKKLLEIEIKWVVPYCEFKHLTVFKELYPGSMSLGLLFRR